MAQPEQFLVPTNNQPADEVGHVCEPGSASRVPMGTQGSQRTRRLPGSFLTASVRASQAAATRGQGRAAPLSERRTAAHNKKSTQRASGPARAGTPASASTPAEPPVDRRLELATTAAAGAEGITGTGVVADMRLGKRSAASASAAAVFGPAPLNEAAESWPHAVSEARLLAECRRVVAAHALAQGQPGIEQQVRRRHGAALSAAVVPPVSGPYGTPPGQPVHAQPGGAGTSAASAAAQCSHPQVCCVVGAGGMTQSGVVRPPHQLMSAAQYDGVVHGLGMHQGAPDGSELPHVVMCEVLAEVSRPEHQDGIGVPVVGQTAFHDAAASGAEQVPQSGARRSGIAGLFDDILGGGGLHEL
mmetsp:Transcript_5355/g.11729  ORF Transcript_5355/g.11729 Transcript_5355/m.11729 type:complete len:359 (-) Transcript_5355:365-1441(-)